MAPKVSARKPRPRTALSLRDFHALFPDEDAARVWFEQARWPDGPVCSKCGSVGCSVFMPRSRTQRCRVCGHQFTVKAGTPMHRSHLPLLVWAQAIYLMVSSSKGISSLKLSEILGIDYKTAWFLTQRIRLMMAADVEAGLRAGCGGHGPLLQGLVEIDEACAGAPPRKRAASNPSPGHVSGDDPPDDDDHPTPPGPPPGGDGAKNAGRKTGRGTPRPMVLVAVERACSRACSRAGEGSGAYGARTSVHASGRSIAKCLPTHSRAAIAQALEGVLDAHATVCTDGLPAYRRLGVSAGGAHAHHTVFHRQRVFARTTPTSEANSPVRVHVNTAESWFAALHRAVVGVFHHLSSKHLDRYASEAAFHWNARASHVLDRIRTLVVGSVGARLTFKDLVGSPAPPHGTVGSCA